MTILNRVGADEVPYVIWISDNEKFGSIKRDSTTIFMLDTNRVDPYHHVVTKNNSVICKAVKHGNDWELLAMWGEVIQKLPDCEGSNQELIISILLAAIQLVERWTDYRKG